MKSIKVVAAIIVNENKVFSTQRGYGDYKGWWEFPGGKIETGESMEDALVREIKEELDADIKIGELFSVVEYDYPKFRITMHCYLCSLESDSITLIEHEDAKWLAHDELDSVKWLPSDIEVVRKLKEIIS